MGYQVSLASLCRDSRFQHRHSQGFLGSRCNESSHRLNRNTDEGVQSCVIESQYRSNGVVEGLRTVSALHPVKFGRRDIVADIYAILSAVASLRYT